jgi:hypothetical protein
MTSSPRNSPILRSRASASNANRFTMRWENGRSVLRSSLLYRILMANFAVAAPTLARHGGRVAARASSAGPDCELCRGGSIFDCRLSLLQLLSRGYWVTQTSSAPPQADTEL